MMTGLWGWITDHATVLSTVVSALAALAVARFTYRLMEVSDKQARLTNETLNLARDEFNATHRPKIRVRAVGMDYKTTDTKQMAIKFSCINIGDAPCLITNVRYRLDATEIANAPRHRMNMDTVELNEKRELEAGEATSFTTPVLTAAEAAALTGQWDFYGFVEYEDKRRISRATGFWRRYEVQTNSWESPDNPDYNYEY